MDGPGGPVTLDATPSKEGQEAGEKEAGPAVGAMLSSLAPAIGATEARMQELSENQRQLIAMLDAQGQDMQQMPGLANVHHVMSNVPLYQKKLEQLKQYMNNIQSQVRQDISAGREERRSGARAGSRGEGGAYGGVR